jgi:hypothetical protein
MAALVEVIRALRGQGVGVQIYGYESPRVEQSREPDRKPEPAKVSAAPNCDCRPTSLPGPEELVE